MKNEIAYILAAIFAIGLVCLGWAAVAFIFGAVFKYMGLLS